jgi:hypothetical protein
MSELHRRLRFCYFLQADFDELVFENGEESVDSIGAAFADHGVEKVELSEAFGDAFFAIEELYLEFDVTEVREPFFVKAGA